MNKSSAIILILIILIVAIAAVGAAVFTSNGENSILNTTNNSTNVTGDNSSVNISHSDSNGSVADSNSSTTTTNNDGSKTVTWSKTNSNGTTESGYVTYDKNGNVIEGAGHEVDKDGNEIGIG